MLCIHVIVLYHRTLASYIETTYISRNAQKLG